MRHRLMLVVAIVSLTAVSSFAQAGQPARAPASPARTWTLTKTSWGDPDLQGVWTSDDYIGVPLQRAADIGTRLQRTEQEIAAAQTNIQNTANRNSQEFANPNAQVSVNPPGHWGEGARRPAQQTSMIIVPEDGRMPALTPEGQARQAARNAAVQQAGGHRRHTIGRPSAITFAASRAV